MALSVADIRTELQIPSQVISDADIAVILVKVSDTDLNLTCAECLRFVLRKYRGRVRYTIGSFKETIDAGELRRQIKNYMSRSAATGTEHTVEADTDDPNWFTRDGI